LHTALFVSFLWNFFGKFSTKKIIYSAATQHFKNSILTTLMPCINGQRKT